MRLKPTEFHPRENNTAPSSDPPADDTDFGRVVTMESGSFAARVYVAVTAAKRRARELIESGDFEGLECPAILGPEILDVIEAADVLRAKLDDHDLSEYLTDEQRRDARRILSILELVRGDMLALTRDGDFPDDGVREVIG